MTADTGPNTTHDGSSPEAGLQQALARLHQAIMTKKSEPICMAYETLRHASAGMKIKDLFEAIDKVVGDTGRHVIISAFSHRQCFMCKGGTVRCDQCNGTGLAEPGRVCTNCEGFGIGTCTFCQGDGWAELTAIPPEIAKSVQERQVHHVMEEIAHLGQRLADLPLEKLQLLDRNGRIKLAEWLIRSQSRVGELQERTGLLTKEQQTQFAAAMADIDRLLRALVECNRNEAVAAVRKMREPPSPPPQQQQE